MNLDKAIRLALVITVCSFLTACVGATTVSTSSKPSQPGFGFSLEESPGNQGVRDQYSGVRLDVIVQIFDPNIPEDPDDYIKQGVWPELRRTEAIRFAVALKDEIEHVNAFGNVRVAPDSAVSGDLFVTGKILHSNGEDVGIAVQVHDVSGARWMKKTYKHRVKQHHWQNIRQSSKDPYQPVFMKTARDIARLLKKKSSDELANLRAISEIQFASAFAQEAFGHHLEFKNKRVKLASMPAVDDPMLVRTRAVRVVDGLFMDKIQIHYTDFVTKTNDSYLSWQEHSLVSAKAKREQESKAAAQAFGAALLIFGAAAAADNSSSDALTDTAIASAAFGGIKLLQDSFASSAEGRYHRDNLMELGGSLNFEVAPQVLQLEETTVTLQGDIKTQFRQWRTFLKELYNKETTPNVQL